MKTIISKKELEKELTILGKIAGRKTYSPVLEMIQLSFLSEHSLMLQATDLIIGHTILIGDISNRKYRIPKTTPQILVSASNLKKVLKAVPKKIKDISLEITWDGQGLIINNTITIICGMLIEDYPIIPKLPFSKSYNITDYNQLICFNSFKAQKDDTRSHVNHLYFDTENGSVVGTDGSRLHAVPLQDNFNSLKPFMIHYDAIKLLTCPQLRNEIGNISLTKRNIFIQTNHGYIVVMQPKEEWFPEYTEVLSLFDYENPRAVISAENKQTFIDEIIEAKAILSTDSKAVTFNLNGRIVLSSINPEIGEFKKDITNNLSYIGKQGIDIEVAFNPEFLISACKDMPDDELYMMSFLDKEHPVIIESETGEFKAAVMPLTGRK